jgi:hypothetical protein
MRHPIIWDAQAHGPGSEQAFLMAGVNAAESLCNAVTAIATDAGYHSEVNVKDLAHIDAYISRQRLPSI